MNQNPSLTKRDGNPTTQNGCHHRNQCSRYDGVVGRVRVLNLLLIQVVISIDKVLFSEEEVAECNFLTVNAGCVLLADAELSD